MFYTKFRLHLTEIMFLGRSLPPLMEKPSFGSTNNCLIQLRDCCDACQVLNGFTMFPTKISFPICSAGCRTGDEVKKTPDKLE